MIYYSARRGFQAVWYRPHQASPRSGPCQSALGMRPRTTAPDSPSWVSAICTIHNPLLSIQETGTYFPGSFCISEDSCRHNQYS